MLRFSYTAFNYWKKNDTQGLLNYFSGIRFNPTPQMRDGLMYDDEACEMAVKEHKLPDHFGGFEVVDPIPQLKMVTKITEGVREPAQLVGVIDTYDQGLIYEYKTGITSSSDYALTLQVPIYSFQLSRKDTEFFTLDENGEFVKRTDLKVFPPVGGRVCRFNQYEGTTDIHHMIIGNHTIRLAKKNILSLINEIQIFMEESGGYEYVKQNKKSGK